MPMNVSAADLTLLSAHSHLEQAVGSQAVSDYTAQQGCLSAGRGCGGQWSSKDTVRMSPEAYSWCVSGGLDGSAASSATCVQNTHACLLHALGTVAAESQWGAGHSISGRRKQKQSQASSVH